MRVNGSLGREEEESRIKRCRGLQKEDGVRGSLRPRRIQYLCVGLSLPEETILEEWMTWGCLSHLRSDNCP